LFLFVGRLSGQKGMPFFRDVIEQTLSEIDAIFLLVGDGPWRERFEKDYPEATLTVGRVPHERIHRYYQAADVYVHTSMYEGLPLVILEALQCGTPVVARRAGDIGLVTDNLVQHPEEMAAWLTSKNWEFEWKAEWMFSKRYQRKQLIRVFEEAVGES
jgi:glycosyltransferase involved in cell wall biosynthesis